MYEELEPFILWLSSRYKDVFTRLCCKIFSFLFFFNFVDGAIFYFIYIISFVDKFPTFNRYLEIGAESQPQVQPVFFGPVPYVFGSFYTASCAHAQDRNNSGWESSELRTEEPCRTLH